MASYKAWLSCAGCGRQFVVYRSVVTELPTEGALRSLAQLQGWRMSTYSGPEGAIEIDLCAKCTTMNKRGKKASGRVKSAVKWLKKQ